MTVNKRIRKLWYQYEKLSTYDLKLRVLDFKHQETWYEIPIELISKLLVAVIPLSALLIAMQSMLPNMFGLSVSKSHASITSIQKSVLQFVNLIQLQDARFWSLTFKTVLGLIVLLGGFMAVRSHYRKHVSIIEAVLNDR